MRILHTVATLSLSSLAALVQIGCVECQSLLDCPNGSICNRDGVCIEECPSGDYSVEVLVTAPDQRTAVAGEVAVDDGGFAQTDAQGATTMTVSSGTHVFQAQRGDFTGAIEIEVCGEGQRVAVPVRPPPGTIGVVSGAYDDIDDVLRGMGFTRDIDYRFINEDDIAAVGGLDELRYIFINCGHVLDFNVPALNEALGEWVRSGGALYTSDWAFDVVEKVFPGHVTGGGLVGAEGDYGASVLDRALSDHLQKTGVELDYNLSAWSHVASIEPNVEELVRGVDGEVRNMPLLVQFDEGEGRVTYTTFHNEAQTTADMDRILSYLVFSL